MDEHSRIAISPNCATKLNELIHKLYAWIQKIFIVTTSIGAAFKAQNMHRATQSMQGFKDDR